MKNLDIKRPELKSKDIQNINDFCNFMEYTPKISWNQGTVKRAIIVDSNETFVGYIQTEPFLSYIDKEGDVYFIFSKKELQRAEKIANEIITPEAKINFDFIKILIHGNNKQSKTYGKTKKKILS
jgi:hypothetical protein